MVALIFYITVAITVVAVILSVMYWIKERKTVFEMLLYKKILCLSH